VSELELTGVSDIPEDPDEANTFYSFEEFEDDDPRTPRTRYSRDESIEELVEGVRKSSSFEHTRDDPVEEVDFNRSFPLSNFSHDRYDTRELHNEPPKRHKEVPQRKNKLPQRHNDSTSQEEDSTIILRSDRIKTLRLKCRDKLGDSLFEKIYSYLNEARFSEVEVEEEVIVQALRDWAPQLTSQCFLVDQLIYLEKQEMLASKLM